MSLVNLQKETPLGKKPTQVLPSHPRPCPLHLWWKKCTGHGMVICLQPSCTDCLCGSPNLISPLTLLAAHFPHHKTALAITTESSFSREALLLGSEEWESA